MRQRLPIRWWVEFTVGATIFGLVVAVGLNLRAGSATARLGSEAATPTFWQMLHVDGASYRWFESVEEMATTATVVVVGHITSVEKGRVFNPEPEFGERGSAHYLEATLVVEQIVHGRLVGGNSPTITVELFAPNVDAIPAVLQTVPEDSALFFLINKSEHPATENLSPEARAAEAKYYQIMGEQARLAISDGRVYASDSLADDEFPSSLNGQRLDDVLASIRAIR